MGRQEPGRPAIQRRVEGRKSHVGPWRSGSRSSGDEHDHGGRRGGAEQRSLHGVPPPSSDGHLGPTRAACPGASPRVSFRLVSRGERSVRAPTSIVGDANSKPASRSRAGSARWPSKEHVLAHLAEERSDRERRRREDRRPPERVSERLGELLVRDRVRRAEVHDAGEVALEREARTQRSRRRSRPSSTIACRCRPGRRRRA